MCVLIVKRAGDKLPSDAILKMCYQANPDGCGFSTVRAWFKSLDFDQFLRVLKRNVSINDDCLIHFRFATHGSVKKENCHPFIDRGAGVAFAHNGVLPILSKNDLTDSEIFFRESFLPTFKKCGWNEQTKNVIKNVIGGSKFAFLDKNEGLKTFGEFYTIKGCKCLFSNLRWDYSRFYVKPKMTETRGKRQNIWSYEIEL